jgi:hypothetical protein
MVSIVFSDDKKYNGKAIRQWCERILEVNRLHIALSIPCAVYAAQQSCPDAILASCAARMMPIDKRLACGMPMCYQHMRYLLTALPVGCSTPWTVLSSCQQFCWLPLDGDVLTVVVLSAKFQLRRHLMLRACMCH